MLDDGHADTHFQLATSLEKKGQHTVARTHYEHALDLDGLRFRADTRINATIERVATDYPQNQVSFVHSLKAFDQASAPHPPGWNFLVEHVHYDFEGNAVLARVFSRAIARHLAASAPRATLSNDEVAARIGFPNHETVENIENLQGIADQPPFPWQSNYHDYLAFLAVELSKVKG